MKTFNKIGVAAVVAGAILLAGCEIDATIASRNLAMAAENFDLNRRIVFLNGITDKYILSVEGRCSIETQPTKRMLAVTCKTGPSQFKKHRLGLSDNVTYFSEQLEVASVSAYRYKVVFKPQVILPDVDFKGSLGGK